MLSLFNFFLLGLATYRLTRLLVFDDITSFIRAPFHDVEEEVADDGEIEEVIYIKGSGIRKFIGDLLSCHWCAGVWSAAMLYIGYTLFSFLFWPIIVILALAAVSGIIQVLVDQLS